MNRTVVVLMLFFGGCTSAEQSLSTDHCEAIATALPEEHRYPDQNNTIFRVSELVGGNEQSPKLAEIISAGFTSYELKSECEFVPRPTEECLELIARYSLKISDWPTRSSLEFSGSLSDCDQLHLGPKITSEDWQATYNVDGFPNVTGLLLFTIDRVVISKNGQQAIVTMQYTCGGLCAEGYSLLLERDSDEWVVLGKQHHWIS